MASANKARAHVRFSQVKSGVRGEKCLHVRKEKKESIEGFVIFLNA
jgi:hypothetical protein